MFLVVQIFAAVTSCTRQGLNLSLLCMYLRLSVVIWISHIHLLFTTTNISHIIVILIIIYYLSSRYCRKAAVLFYQLTWLKFMLMMLVVWPVNHGKCLLWNWMYKSQYRQKANAEYAYKSNKWLTLLRVRWNADADRRTDGRTGRKIQRHWDLF